MLPDKKVSVLLKQQISILAVSYMVITEMLCYYYISVSYNSAMATKLAPIYILGSIGQRF